MRVCVLCMFVRVVYVCGCVTYGLDQVVALPHQLLCVSAVGGVLGHGLKGGQDLRVQDPQALGLGTQHSMLAVCRVELLFQYKYRRVRIIADLCAFEMPAQKNMDAWMLDNKKTNVIL